MLYKFQKEWNRLYHGLPLVGGQRKEVEVNKKTKIGFKGGKNEAITIWIEQKGKNVLENICGQFPVNGFINNIFGV